MNKKLQRTGWGGREVRTLLCDSMESSTSGRRRPEEVQNLRCGSKLVLLYGWRPDVAAWKQTVLKVGAPRL